MVALSRVPFFVSRKQQQFLDAEENFRGFCAGRSTGKTEIGVADLLLKAKPDEPYMVVSPTNGNLLDTTIPKFYRVAKRLGWQQVFNQKNCGPGKYYIRESFSPFPWAKIGLKGGSAEIIFRSGEEPDRLAGPSMAALWLDEASKMRKSVMEIGLPVLRHNGRWGRLTMTFTPRGTRHWTFGFFYEQVNAEEAASMNGQAEYIQGRWYKRRAGYRLIRSHSSENPFNPKTYVVGDERFNDLLLAKARAYETGQDLITLDFSETLSEHYTRTLAAQEFGGEFVELAGLLFQEEWFRFQDESPRRAMRVRYWDRAGTQGAGDFSAGVLMAKAGGVFFIEDVKRGQWSAMERNRVIVETAQQDAARYNNEVVIYGEQEGGSAGKEISEQFIRMLAGYPVYRDIVSGRRSRVVDKLQLPGEAKIVRALPFAAQAEAGNVVILRRPWTEAFLNEITNFPESEHDDQCLVAGTLVLTARGEIPIERVLPGDRAWTRDGWRKVLWSGMTNIRAKTLRILLANGRMLRGTHQHPLWVEKRGFVPLSRIRPGDLCLCVETLKPLKDERLLNSIERFSIATKTPSDGSCEFTFGATGEAEGSRFIRQFGFSTTEKFRKERSSTIKTETRSTIDWTILNALTMPCTNEFMQTTATIRATRQLSTSMKFATWPRIGTDHRKAGLGTRLMRSNALNSGKMPNSYVTTAERNTPPKNADATVFARHPARRPRDLCGPERIAEHANGAAVNLPPTRLDGDFAVSLVPISSVTVSGRRPVYNLKIEGQPEYFANGALVHNCDAASGCFEKLTHYHDGDPGEVIKAEVETDAARYGMTLVESRMKRRGM